MSALLKKFSNLLCVKSIVTLVLTVVFAISLFWTEFPTKIF